MTVASRRLTIEDIVDLRAYERDRVDFKRLVMDLKRRRRVALGEIMSLVFENLVTVRYQVQEMARAEKMLTDEQIQAELDVYNPLIPQPGELSATLFLELTDEASLRAWLPKLVGVERSLELQLGWGDDLEAIASTPEADHAGHLTREDMTASVHYVRFGFTPAQVERFGAGPVVLACVHPEYERRHELSPETVESLLEDLRST